MKFRQGLALVLVAVMAVVAGCSSKPTEAPKTDAQPAAPVKPVTIQFWHGMSYDVTQGKVTQDLVKQFNATHPNIIVQDTYQGAYADLDKKLTSAIAAQTPPDVVQMTDSMLSNYARASALQALDSIIDAKELADYPPALLTSDKMGGKLMALPFNRSAILLIYDPKVVPTPPTNWEEFHAAAKAGTKGTMAGTAWANDVYTFAQFFAQAGGQWLSADGKTATYNSDAGVQALQFMVDMVKDGSAAVLKPGEYQSNYFNAGQAAMVPTTSASFAYIKPADGKAWKVAPLFKGKQAAVPLSGASVTIMNGIDKEHTAAAATFVTWLTGKEATLKFAMGKTGYGPVRLSATKDPAWQDFVKQNPEYGMLADALQSAVVMPNIKQWNAIQQTISDAVQKACLGQLKPKDALDASVKAANDLLAKQ